jgi:hypothetical protein
MCSTLHWWCHGQLTHSRVGPAVRPAAPIFTESPILLCLLCHCSQADIWLNDPEVRAAIHAAPQDVTGPWQLCSDRIFYTSNGGSMLPIHSYLVREAGAYDSTGGYHLK